MQPQQQPHAASAAHQASAAGRRMYSGVRFRVETGAM